MYNELGISDRLVKLAKETEKKVEPVFKKIDEICEINSLKVLKAFQENKISDMHFNQTTGYGYGDIGRDTCERVFADIFLSKQKTALLGDNLSQVHML